MVLQLLIEERPDDFIAKGKFALSAHFFSLNEPKNIVCRSPFVMVANLKVANYFRGSKV